MRSASAAVDSRRVSPGPHAVSPRARLPWAGAGSCERAVSTVSRSSSGRSIDLPRERGYKRDPSARIGAARSAARSPCKDGEKLGGRAEETLKAIVDTRCGRASALTALQYDKSFVNSTK